MPNPAFERKKPRNYQLPIDCIKEAKIFSSFMMANILKILHPFIPFFTEYVWSKNNYKSLFKEDLILSSWPNYKDSKKFFKNQIIINNLIELISNIRSIPRASYQALGLSVIPQPDLKLGVVLRPG